MFPIRILVEGNTYFWSKCTNHSDGIFHVPEGLYNRGRPKFFTCRFPKNQDNEERELLKIHKMNHIISILDKNSVVLFMKGTPENPFCGFSRYVVHILNILHVPFLGVDVLTDPQLREDIKIFSNWPTFPQLYVHQKLIGGCDIIREMYEDGELQKILEPLQKVP